VENIPPELGNLSFDSYLGNYIDLSHNQLSGNIPPELGNLSFRAYNVWDNNTLDLSYNQLSGAIPPELGWIFNLKYLSLNNNRFTFDGMELVAQKFPHALI
jgi:hypothetical protein